MPSRDEPTAKSPKKRCLERSACLGFAFVWALPGAAGLYAGWGQFQEVAFWGGVLFSLTSLAFLASALSLYRVEDDMSE